MRKIGTVGLRDSTGLKVNTEEHDFERYGYEWLDGEQIIMIALIEILELWQYGYPQEPNRALISELRKRSSKQRMHIPIFERGG